MASPWRLNNVCPSVKKRQQFRRCNIKTNTFPTGFPHQAMNHLGSFLQGARIVSPVVEFAVVPISTWLGTATHEVRHDLEMLPGDESKLGHVHRARADHGSRYAEPPRGPCWCRWWCRWWCRGQEAEEALHVAGSECARVLLRGLVEQRRLVRAGLMAVNILQVTTWGPARCAVHLVVNGARAV